MANKKKLNLQFGAEIKELVVEYQAQQFKSLSGNIYSFVEFTKNLYLTKLMTQGFQYVQSINYNDKAKHKTNDSIRYGIRTFLAWIEKIDYLGELDSNILLKFKEYLSSKNSSTAYAIYTIIARISQELITKKIVKNFIIPKNISLQQAKNSSKVGITIATSLKNEKINLSQDDINEKVLSLILASAWEETFKLFDLLKFGNELCVNLENKKYIEYNKEMTREQALQAMIKNMYIEFGGLSSEYSMIENFPGYYNKAFVKIFSSYLNANYKNKWGINSFEINKYFNPTKELAGNILILLYASHINPESANTLNLNCLKGDTEKDIVRISWVKNRAGGEQLSMPFPKGKHDRAKTIPNILNLYKYATEKIRKDAPNHLKELMFIWKNNKTGKRATIQHCNLSGNNLIKDALILIKQNIINQNKNDEIYQLSIKSCDILTPSLIRTTALNIAGKRLNRDISNLALMDGRRTEQPLINHYLNNSSTREAFDSQIREAQSLMFNWVNCKPIIVENKEELTQSLNISEEKAEQIMNNEFNNGYGASLINEYVIIIDSPLNALRIIQWLKKLEDNEQKMLISNPERWNTVYLPQKKLFNDVLGLISKKHKNEALKMNKQFTLPFPEVL